MEFIYDEYDKSSTFKQYGEYASVIASRFVEKSGIDLGDAGAQLEAISLLVERGWLKIVRTGRRTDESRITIISKIKPTNEGIKQVERRRQPWFKRRSVD